MKRAVSFVILGIALLTGIAWSVQYFLRRHEAKQWQVLSEGRQVRFLAATKGPFTNSFFRGRRYRQKFVMPFARFR